MVLDFRRILSVYQELFLSANFGEGIFNAEGAEKTRRNAEEKQYQAIIYPPLRTFANLRVLCG
jgi:hypothetical protein